MKLIVSVKKSNYYTQHYRYLLIVIGIKVQAYNVLTKTFHLYDAVSPKWKVYVYDHIKSNINAFWRY